MSPRLERCTIMLACFALTCLFPAMVGAQPPAYLTQWGTYGSGDGQFNGPYGVATDAFGNVYVVDQNNNRIQKFTSTGTYLAQWGTFGSGNGQFAIPAGIATDAAGNVYVADRDNFRIQKFTGSGTYLTQWGTYGTGAGQLINP